MHELLTCKLASMKLRIGLDQSGNFTNALFHICILYSSTRNVFFSTLLSWLLNP